MRLGLFGGTFDPVHIAHLLLAETCLEDGALDEVWFVPNSRSPHKQDAQIADVNDRVEMLKLAIGGNSRFRICSSEIERGGLSYTVETLEQIHHSNPHDELFLLMGADSLADFPNWKAPDRICELATPLVVQRPDSPTPDFSQLSKWLDDEQLAPLSRHSVKMPQLDIGSTEIRHRVATGRSIRYRTPRAVELYIQTHDLYKARHRAD